MSKSKYKNTIVYHLSLINKILTPWALKLLSFFLSCSELNLSSTFLKLFLTSVYSSLNLVILLAYIYLSWEARRSYFFCIVKYWVSQVIFSFLVFTIHSDSSSIEKQSQSYGGNVEWYLLYSWMLLKDLILSSISRRFPFNSLLVFLKSSYVDAISKICYVFM